MKNSTYGLNGRSDTTEDQRDLNIQQTLST